MRCNILILTNEKDDPSGSAHGALYSGSRCDCQVQSLGNCLYDRTPGQLAQPVSHLRGCKTMPIYEYACRSCEHQFESIQKASEQPLQDCPACGEPTLKKLLSAPVFRLKGSGWYETDFKTGDKRNVAGAGDAEGGKADEKAGDKADASKAGAAAGGGADKAKAGAENGKAAKADAKPAKDAGSKAAAAGGKPAAKPAPSKT